MSLIARLRPLSPRTRPLHNEDFLYDHSNDHILASHDEAHPGIYASVSTTLTASHAQ